MHIVRSSLLGAALAILGVACAAPIQQVSSGAPPRPSGLQDQRRVSSSFAGGRPLVGVAFGGGSARGIAHVGVIRWFDEHRIPIDVAAGTSMGGLIGGAFATGMDADEIQQMLRSIDWDTMFGSSNFAFKNIRRKIDARVYPARLEFGLKRGLVAQTALNNGEQVDLLITRITAPYAGVEDFDTLPTPFRTVAVDLVTATEVVLDRGSLSRAMRATMSIPLVFPPVELEGRVLVDGGAMNNVPADVVRAMGADRVVAVNVGELGDAPGVSYSMLGLAGATLDAMMRASTKSSIASADVILNVPLKEFGSLDWRRSDELIDAGYAAAEAMRDQLLPFAVSETDYAEWKRGRESRRRRDVPVPAFVNTVGFSKNDDRRLSALMPKHAGVPLDIPSLEHDLSELTGLDRYETITWRLVRNDQGQPGLEVVGQPKPYAPPFMMLGLNLENTTSTDFRMTLTGRYLTYGLLTSGSELRLDGTIGSSPAFGGEFYQPIGSTALFVAPYAGISTDTAASLSRDQILAKYGITTSRLGINVGTNLGPKSDLRFGAYVGHVDASVDIGDLLLPELNGKEEALVAAWRYDGQDSPVIPSGGLLAQAQFLHLLDAPDGRLDGQRVPVGGGLRQLSGAATRFWSLGEKNRVFVYGGMGTSFGDQAQPTYTFTLGSPLRLGAYRQGELRGSNYYIGTAGYLRQVARLPDFLGGGMFAGAWTENGDTFEKWDLAQLRSNLTFGVVMDTLLGPVMVAGSSSYDGRWRTYISVGRLFR